MGKIRVGVFGFGKAGHSVVQEFINDGSFEVVWVIRKNSTEGRQFASRLLGIDANQGEIFSISELNEDFFVSRPVDMIVDFSDTAGVRHYESAARSGISVISAISNYEADDKARLEALSENTAVLYSPNITLGINVLMVASQILQKIAPHADVEIVEEHFKGKKDVSGTAKRIADCLALDHSHIRSIRAGGIVGRHEIIFGMPNQTIRLVHESISRAAFGQGAVFAAKFLAGKPKGLYNMDNVIAEMFRNNLPVY